MSIINPKTIVIVVAIVIVLALMFGGPTAEVVTTPDILYAGDTFTYSFTLTVPDTEVSPIPDNPATDPGCPDACTYHTDGYASWLYIYSAVSDDAGDKLWDNGMVEYALPQLNAGDTLTEAVSYTATTTDAAGQYTAVTTLVKAYKSYNSATETWGCASNSDCLTGETCVEGSCLNYLDTEGAEFRIAVIGEPVPPAPGESWVEGIFNAIWSWLQNFWCLISPTC